MFTLYLEEEQIPEAHKPALKQGNYNEEDHSPQIDLIILQVFQFPLSFFGQIDLEHSCQYDCTDPNRQNRIERRHGGAVVCHREHYLLVKHHRCRNKLAQFGCSGSEQASDFFDFSGTDCLCKFLCTLLDVIADRFHLRGRRPNCLRSPAKRLACSPSVCFKICRQNIQVIKDFAHRSVCLDERSTEFLDCRLDFRHIFRPYHIDVLAKFDAYGSYFLYRLLLLLNFGNHCGNCCCCIVLSVDNIIQIGNQFFYGTPKLGVVFRDLII